MRDPLRTAYSRDEIVEEARKFCVTYYGKPSESNQEKSDKWFERFGLLCSFLYEKFPVEETEPKIY